MTATLPSTDHAAFLRAICESPADDAPRLIFADWLDENGEAERAEFIRVQVELFRIERFTNEPARTDTADLRSRERELLESACKTLWVVLPKLIPVGSVISASGSTVRAERYHNSTVELDFSRGFISAITLTTSDFLANVQALFTQPIERVTLSDKRPNAVYIPGRPRDMFAWEEHGERQDRRITLPFEASIPPEIFRRMGSSRFDFANPPRFRRLSTESTEQAALDALSAACVTYGRSTVGLPPMLR